jgi:exocyst complex component 3
MASPLLGAGSTYQGGTTTSMVADYLKSPDDLSKIPALRKKLLKEQASLSAKLKSGAKEQLEATRDGLLKLQATRKDVATIRESFGEVDSLCGDSGADSGRGTIKSFRVISEVSQIHRNFVQTSENLDKLIKLPSQIEALAILLNSLQANLFNPRPELLAAHFQISQLELFRNQTLQIGRSCSLEVRETLQEYFAPLDGLIKSFEEYLMSLCGQVMELAREGRGHVVVLVIKIIEKESREDEKAAAIRLAKKANLEGAARFQSYVANARVIKLYRPKLMEKMDDNTKELFAECWDRFGGASSGSNREDPSGFLERLDWVYEDLAFVKQEMVRLFPNDYNIHRFFVKSYHKHLGNTLRRKVLDTDPEASVLLTLYQFSQEYKKTMTKEMEIPVEWLEPSLLGGKEQSIIDDYLSLITKKIDEWTANLMSDEIGEFVSRQKAPDESAEGLYGVQYASILFQMVNQQIEVAADSGQANILVRATTHACQAMRGTQSSWLRVLEQEFRKHREAKSPDDVTQGLVEYVIALANDQLKSADYAEAFQGKVEGMVSSKYKGQVKESVDNAINGYLDVSKRCTQVLVDLVFLDLRPALKELFAFPAWYSEGIMTTVVETIRDYTADYSDRLNPDLFDVLCDDLIDRFLTVYLGGLRRATKLRMPAAGEKVRADVEECKSMFSAYKNPEELVEKFQVMDMM